MSAKPCDTCGKLITFGEDIYGRIIVLEIGAPIYRVVKGMNVEIDSKAMLLHSCFGRNATIRIPEKHFSEPKESA